MPDVIVLGAGLAGLAAAARIAEAGRRVAIVEARDRVGGRAWTVHDPRIDYPVELGPEWFDSYGAIHRLLAAEHVAMRQADGDFLRRTPAGIVPSAEPTAGERALRERLAGFAEPDRSLRQALEECRPGPDQADAAAMLMHYVEGFHAADPGRLSLQWLMQVEENQPAGESEFRTTAGLDVAVAALQRALPPGCDLRLGTTAVEVRWRRGHVEVDVERAGVTETLAAGSAVVTLPLAVLAAAPGEPGAVRFAPALHSKRRAFDTLATGPAVKIVFVLEHPFWNDIRALDDMLFIQDPTRAVPTWWTPRPVDAPVLTGWVAGPQVHRLAGIAGEALRDLAIESAAGAFGVPPSDVASLVRSWHAHDWQADPFARGAYSWVAVGGIDSHALLAAPLDEVLYFAGEATCGDGFNATMDGAIESGWRAARELLGVG